jgi:hypothetical protein
MSGAELLAVVGGVAACLEIFSCTKKLLSLVRSGPFKDQLEPQILGILLRCRHLEDLQKLGLLWDESEAAAFETFRKHASSRLKSLEALIEADGGSEGCSKPKQLLYALKRQERIKKIEEALACLDNTFQAIDRIIQTRLLCLTYTAIAQGPQQSSTVLLDLNHQDNKNTNPNQLPSHESIETDRVVPTQMRCVTENYFLRYNRPSRCSRGTCFCLCHASSKTVYQNARLEGTTWRSMAAKCSCDSKTFHWTINMFQKRLSLRFWVEYTNGFSLNASLPVRNTVPRTSPLFVVLFKCRQGLMTLDDAVLSIRKILDSRLGSVNDVDRDGNGWFEVSNRDTRTLDSTKHELKPYATLDFSSGTMGFERAGCTVRTP